MACITKQKNGRKRIEFVYGEKRHCIYLGKMSMKLDNEVKTKVEDIIAAKIAGHTSVTSTQHWIAEQRKQNSKMIEKLAELELVNREYRPDVEDTLDTFIGSFIHNRTDVKEGTRITYRQARRRLVGFFGKDRRLTEITVGEAKQWRRSLLNNGLSEATVNRTSSTANQFFKEAIDLKAISVNPFKGLPTVVRGNPEKFHFVDRPTIEKVIEACPSAEWRLLVGLARYAGLRIPSESAPLKWEDISLDGTMLTITSPKTAHHGKGARVCPIFPELRPLVEDARQAAPADSVLVFQRYRNKEQNLRTHFKRIIKKAGVEPWVKLWQNLRSSRFTELTDNGFPIQAVTKWLGNTPKIAKEHYLQVTDEHWRRAVTGETKHSKNVAESTAVPSGLGMNRVAQSFRNESVTVERAMRNNHLHEQVGAKEWARQDSNL